ncbi:MAG: site-specific integrase [Clostridia bacterium]|nr:site-specific integrase [Clostridia bacterium]
MRNNTVGFPNLDNSTGSFLMKGNDIMNAATPLKDYVKIWMTTFKSNSIKSASYDRLQTSLTALEKYEISNQPIQDITFFDIQRYVNELVDNGYALTTIKKQLRIVTAPLKQAAAMHVIPCDPSCGVVLPSAHKVKKRAKEATAYTTEEQLKLWAEINKSEKVGYLCVGLMIATGLRAGEALALTWNCIDIPRRRLKVTSTVVNLANTKQSFVQDSPKSVSSIRTIPLTDAAVQVLLRAKESGSDWVFSCGESHLSYEALRYQTMLLCKAANVPYLGEHVFRHTFATNCYYKGMDVKILSKVLGHSNTNVTYNTYINLYGDAFDEMYAAING